MKNRTILILTICMLFSMIAQTQTYISIPLGQADELIADAGEDTEIEQSGNIMIGGNPTASGGTADYFYSWTPVDNLNDNAIANPTASPTETTDYTVVVTDINGCTSSDELTIAVTVSVNNLVSGVLCNIYPNPSMNYISVELVNQNVSDNLKIEIINSLGQSILSENIKFENKITKQFDISNYSKGLYFIQIQGSKINITKEFIIN